MQYGIIRMDRSTDVITWQQTLERGQIVDRVLRLSRASVTGDLAVLHGERFSLDVDGLDAPKEPYGCGWWLFALSRQWCNRQRHA